jgi:hypothetical protein
MNVDLSKNKSIIKLELVVTEDQKKLVKSVIENHHSYVPSNSSVGRRIDWLVYLVDDTSEEFFPPPDKELLGMIGIGSSVYPPPKDILTETNLTKNQYKEVFNSFANNWRFCLKRKIPNAGTMILKQLRKLAPIEWKKKYGDDLKYIITFVAGGNNGAVYRADNWKCIGETAGLPSHKSVSMKWDSGEQLKEKFVKPTGENKKLIFIKALDETKRCVKIKE